MARREVIEVTCDRCSKTETQDKSEESKTSSELIVEFQGVRHEYADLCMRCRKACEGYFKSLTKQSDEKGEPEVKEEKKTGIFGIGQK